MSITLTVEFRAAVMRRWPEQATEVTSPPQSLMMLTVRPESRSQHLRKLDSASKCGTEETLYLMLPSLLPLQTNEPLASLEDTHVTAAS